MNSVVIFASRSGNTRRVAEAIADGLRSHGPVEVFEADDAPTALPAGTDLLVVGGPTEGRSATEPIRQFFGRLQRGALEGVMAAAFDTRLSWPRVLSGSAADDIVESLRKKGANVVVPAESFIVNSKPLLKPGELERAPEWAGAVAGATSYAIRQAEPVVAG